MKKVFDGKGNAITLGKKLGSGGEGAVFSVENRENIVAKIYHEQISPHKARKLKYMVELQNEKLLKTAAWAVETLHAAPDGETVGFLMQSVTAKEIHELYTIKSRKRYFPRVDWRFLIHVATNVARAFYAVHTEGHTLGDVNHGNCVVLRDGTVKLIDCDSYTITTGEEVFHCEVGVSTHTAPELQGKNLREFPRNQNHDAFGLAVIIFQLLFIGRHPFSGTILRGEDKSLEECIAQNLFAYAEDSHVRGIRQPPASLPLSAVSNEVGSLFKRAFLQNNDRPTAEQWILALKQLADGLVQCNENHSHHYFSSQSSELIGNEASCVWCNLEESSKIAFFEGNDSSLTKTQSVADLVTIDNLLKSLKEIAPLTRMPYQSVTYESSTQSVQLNNRITFSLAATLGVSILVIFWLTSTLGLFGMVSSLIFTLCAVNAVTWFFREDVGELEKAMLTARNNCNDLEVLFSYENKKGDTYYKQLYDARLKTLEVKQLTNTHSQRVKELESELRKVQFDKYLQEKVIILNSKIPLTFRQAELLENRGLRTAKDVAKVFPVRIPQFPELESLLNDWYLRISNDFKFNPQSESALTLLNEANWEQSGIRQRLRSEIDSQVRPIEENLDNWLVKLREMETVAKIKLAELSQAQTDFENVKPTFLRYAVFICCWLITSLTRL